MFHQRKSKNSSLRMLNQTSLSQGTLDKQKKTVKNHEGVTTFRPSMLKSGCDPPKIDATKHPLLDSNQEVRFSNSEV
ncbi:hypothetical protein O181_087323 [Austropuccinia psidii MF-1]|uniref:Uncharacterized protein n=1 Tax=Austropuccinia psidii MF-1 TaxID=1389203 RepID=A0A9Q3P0Y0_9BASI|nr:hypothetical protein [Austropuccinia psidii MF-1]